MINPAAQGPSVSAFGSINHVVVVCDEDLWNGPVGDSLRYLFESAYPILPQPESIFDLRQMPYSDIIGLKSRRELRNYIFVADLSKIDSSALNLLNNLIGAEKLRSHVKESKYSNLITTDVWARGQQLMYLIGENQNDLIARIKNSFPGLSKQIRDLDNITIKANTYAAGDAKFINAQLANRFGINMDIPADFKLASDKNTGIWLRKETEIASFNLILSKLKYSSTQQLSKDGLKTIRDSLSRSFVTTASPGDYMVINDKDLPLFIYQKNIDGNYGIEARGVWETKIEFMGGPFQTYMFQSPAKDSIMYIDAFVFAPEQEKRNLMQQLEAIVSTFHFK